MKPEESYSSNRMNRVRKGTTLDCATQDGGIFPRWVKWIIRNCLVPQQTMRGRKQRWMYVCGRWGTYKRYFQRNKKTDQVKIQPRNPSKRRWFKIQSQREKQYRWMCYPDQITEFSHLFRVPEASSVGHLNFINLDKRTAKTNAWCQGISMDAVLFYWQKAYNSEENANIGHTNLMGTKQSKVKPDGSSEEKRWTISRFGSIHTNPQDRERSYYWS